MVSHRVVLRCLDATGDVQDIELSEREGVSVHQLLKPTEAETHIAVRTEDVDEVQQHDDALGFLLTGGPFVQFCPAVDDISIEFPNSEGSGDPSKENKSKILQPAKGICFQRLKDSSVIRFGGAGLTLQINLATELPAQDVGGRATEDNVQVKSSLSDFDRSIEQAGHMGVDKPAPDSTSGEDDDLDNARQGVETPGQRAYEVTPATSLYPVSGTVKDTPARAESRDSNQPFSTAFTAVERVSEGLQDNGATPSLSNDDVQLPESPSIRASESQELRMRKAQMGPAQASLSAELLRTDKNIDAGKLNYAWEDDSEPSFMSTKDDDRGRLRPTKTYLRNKRSLHNVLREVDESPFTGVQPARTAIRSSTDQSSSHGLDARAIDAKQPGDSMDETIADGETELPSFDDERVGKSITGKRTVSRPHVDNENEEPAAKRSRCSPLAGDRGGDLEDGDGDVSVMVCETDAKASRAAARSRILESIPNKGSKSLPVIDHTRVCQPETDEIAVASATLPQRKPTKNARRLPLSPNVVISRGRQSETPGSTTEQTRVSKSPMVLMTKSSQATDATRKWLKGQGAQLIDDVPSKVGGFVCVVGNGELGSTAKLLRTLVLGQPVVTEKWLVDSKKAGHLLDFEDFRHKELAQTAGKDRSSLFNGIALVFTKQLVSKYGTEGWSSIQTMCREAGCDQVVKCSASRASEMAQGSERVVLLGFDPNDDNDAKLLMEDGLTVYKKDLIPHSIINGELDLSDGDMKLQMKQSATSKRGRKKQAA